MPGRANNGIRYAIYTRQSVEKADDLGSCDVQFMTCRDFARATGEPGLHWTDQRFDDDGYSGATLDRPAMRKLRKVIDLGGIDRLYAVALDRLTRSMRDAIVLLDELDKAGVALRLVHQAELTSGPENRFLRHVLAAFAEFERDMIATRIAESRAYLKKHGRRLAGPVPYGYDAHPGTKQLVPNSKGARRARPFARAPPSPPAGPAASTAPSARRHRQPTRRVVPVGGRHHVGPRGRGERHAGRPGDYRHPAHRRRRRGIPVRQEPEGHLRRQSAQVRGGGRPI